MTTSSFPSFLRIAALLGTVTTIAGCAASGGPDAQVQAPPYAPAPYAAAPQQPYTPAPRAAVPQPYAPAPYAAVPAPAPVAPRPQPRQYAQPQPRQQPQQIAPQPRQQAQHHQPVPPRAPAPQADQQAAISGTAFPTGSGRGEVPPGSRLVVRVYDAAGGDVNVRVAEGAFPVESGLPARYEVPVSLRTLRALELPAVAARVESPQGGVVFRNEAAVLLKSGAPGDIPMTRQSKEAASAVTREWKGPKPQ